MMNKTMIDGQHSSSEEEEESDEEEEEEEDGEGGRPNKRQKMIPTLKKPIRARTAYLFYSMARRKQLKEELSSGSGGSGSGDSSSSSGGAAGHPSSSVSGAGAAAGEGDATASVETPIELVLRPPASLSPAKRLALEWQNMNDEKKQPYVSMCMEDATRFQQQMEEYNTATAAAVEAAAAAAALVAASAAAAGGGGGGGGEDEQQHDEEEVGGGAPQEDVLDDLVDVEMDDVVVPSGVGMMMSMEAEDNSSTDNSSGSLMMSYSGMDQRF